MPPRSGGGLRSRGRRTSLERWRGPESNRRHHGFQPCALPTELPRQTGGQSSDKKRTSGPVLPCRGRPLARDPNRSGTAVKGPSADEVDDEPPAGTNGKHLRSVAVGDRDRNVLIRVLVEDDVAGPRVGEGTRGGCVGAVRAEIELDAPTWENPGLLHV